MQYILKKRVLYLAVIFTAFSFSQVEAQIWGKLKDAVKKKAEEVVTKEIGDKATEKSKQEKAKKSQATSGKNNTQKQISTYGGKSSSLDIVGLKLGMTPDQVVDFLKKRNKDFKIEIAKSKDRRFNPAYVASIKALLPSRKEEFFINFAMPPISNLSVSITRRVVFEEGKRPLTLNISAALKKRYGDVSYEDRRYLYWSFNQDNTQDTRSERKRQSRICTSFMGREITLTMYRDSDKPNLLKCGISVVANYFGQTDIIGTFSTTLANVPLMIENQSKTQKYIADQNEDEAQKRKEKASKVNVDTDF